MRAPSAANRIGMCEFQHGSLDVSERYRPDDRLALVANDIRLIVASADDQATTAVHVLDAFMGHDQQAI